MSVSKILIDSRASMVLQNHQKLIELTSNMIYITLGVGLKYPHKIHLNTQCPPTHTLQYLISKCDKVKFSESKFLSRLLTLSQANLENLSFFIFFFLDHFLKLQKQLYGRFCGFLLPKSTKMWI